MFKRSHDQLYDLIEEARIAGGLDAPLWRTFLCQCCRSVLAFIRCPNADAAIQWAEAVAAGEKITDDFIYLSLELDDLTAKAWTRLLSLKLGPRNDFEWPVSKEVDQAWIEYYSAQSLAHTTTENPEVGANWLAQYCIYGWATYRTLQGAEALNDGDDTMSTELRGNLVVAAYEQEVRRQIEIFKNLLESRDARK